MALISEIEVDPDDVLHGHLEREFAVELRESYCGIESSAGTSSSPGRIVFTLLPTEEVYELSPDEAAAWAEALLQAAHDNSSNPIDSWVTHRDGGEDDPCGIWARRATRENPAMVVFSDYKHHEFSRAEAVALANRLLDAVGVASGSKPL